MNSRISTEYELHKISTIETIIRHTVKTIRRIIIIPLINVKKGFKNVYGTAILLVPILFEGVPLGIIATNPKDKLCHSLQL